AGRELGVIRQIPPKSRSVNQRLPSGPATSEPGMAVGSRPAPNAVILPLGVMRPNGSGGPLQASPPRAWGMDERFPMGPGRLCAGEAEVAVGSADDVERIGRELGDRSARCDLPDRRRAAEGPRIDEPDVSVGTGHDRPQCRTWIEPAAELADRAARSHPAD